MDKISPDRRSKNMQRIKSKNTGPELFVRKLLFSLGYRYRIHWKRLPGKPDVVFPGKNKVIFVHGCFWHQHADKSCKHVHTPKSRLDYWLPKFERTKERDAGHQAELSKLGWKYLLVWECELDNLSKLKNKVAEYLDGDA